MAAGRPHASEFNEYYAGYIAQVPDGDIVSILRAQHKETLATLERRSDQSLRNRPRGLSLATATCGTLCRYPSGIWHVDS